MLPCLWRAAALGFVLAALGRTAGADEGRVGVLFYASFDKGIDADFACGEAGGRPLGGAVKRENGRRGMALLAGDGSASVTYAMSGNFEAEQGTIEFWFKPLDWDWSDDRFHAFVNAPEPAADEFPKSTILIWKKGHDVNPRRHNHLFFCMADTLNSGGPYISAHSRPQGRVQQGQWYHMVAVWHPLELKLFINGELYNIPVIGGGTFIDRGRTTTNDLVRKRFVVGDILPSANFVSTLKKEKRDAHTLIDEFYVYDYALTDDEALWTFDNALGRPPGQTPGGVTEQVYGTRLLPDGFKKKIDVEVFVHRHAAADFGGAVSLEPDSGTTPASIQQTGPGRGLASMPIPQLPAGDYEVVTSVQNARGSPLGTHRAALKAPGLPTWKGNRIGVAETPPPPWTPVKGDETTLECWGRRYELGALGLPSQIETVGTRVLVRPVELRMIRDGHTAAWRRRHRTLVEQDKLKVVVTGESESSVATARWKWQGEYDGVIRYDIDFEPVGDVEVDVVELRVPMHPDAATLYVLDGTSWGAIPPEGVQKGWNPIWWVGNEEGGVSAFCDSSRHVDRLDRGDIFRIERTADSVDVVWRFVTERRRLEPWSLTFGLMATPAKDTSKHQRAYHDYTGAGSVGMQTNVWMGARIGGMAGPQRIGIEPPPEMTMEQYWQFRRDMKERAGGAKWILPHTYNTLMFTELPEWGFYRSRWDGGLDMTDWKIAAAVPTQDYIDFQMSYTEHWVKKLKLNGLYIDFGFPRPSGNQEAGVGYMRDGTWINDTAYFGFRQLFQRIYTMMKQIDSENLVLHHIGGRLNAPAVAYADVYLTGERNWAAKDGVLLGDSYLDRIPLDGWRAAFMGHPFGTVSWFLPQFNVAKLAPEQWVDPAHPDWPEGLKSPIREVSDRLLGIGLLHDTYIDPRGDINPDATIPYNELMAEFGPADATFFPYWDNADLIGGQNEVIKASAYRKPSGGALVVVLNTTRETQAIDLQIDWERLKSDRPLEVVDAFTKEPVAAGQGSTALAIKGLAYRLLWVK